MQRADRCRKSDGVRRPATPSCCSICTRVTESKPRRRCPFPHRKSYPIGSGHQGPLEQPPNISIPRPPSPIPIPAKPSGRLVRNSDRTRLHPPRSHPVSRCIIRMGRGPCVLIFWEAAWTVLGMEKVRFVAALCDLKECVPSLPPPPPSSSRTAPIPVHGAHT